MLRAQRRCLALLLLLLAVAAGAVGVVVRGSGQARVFLVQVAEGVDAQAHVIAALTIAGVPQSDIVIRTRIATKLFNAVSFSLSSGDRSIDDAVTSISGAINVWRVAKRVAPVPVRHMNVSDYPAEAIHSITGVNAVREKFGFLGEDVKVAIIDTGVYYNHPALGGGFGPGFKVAGGYDFVGDDYSAANPFPVPDSDPLDDCSAISHGTHVAGIVAADARNITSPSEYVPVIPFTGVAPRATILAYRVYGCAADSTTSDIVAAAIFRAAEDGAHVINLSLGGGPAFSDDVDAFAAELVGAHGHIVLGAAGNDGVAGVYSVGSPAVSRGGFGVASVDNVAFPEPAIFIDEIAFSSSFGIHNASFEFDTEYDIIVNDLNADENNSQNDGTGALLVNATGKALLIRDGPFYLRSEGARCDYARRAGAIACIVYSQDESITDIAGSSDIPTLLTMNSAGLAVIDAVKNGRNPKFIVSGKYVNFPIPTAGTVSAFSSPGLDPELFIKPDFAAIGGVVYSTISPFAALQLGQQSDYAFFSGTSMATPYAAGIVALYLQSKSGAPVAFQDVRTALQNSANPVMQVQTGLQDSVANQGAGLLNIYNALTSKTVVQPSAIALNDTSNARQHYTISITNLHSSAVTYTLSSNASLMITPFATFDDTVLGDNAAQYTADYATVEFASLNQRVSSLQFNLEAGETRLVNVHFTPPATADPALYPIYSGYIVVSAPGENDIHVPYAGVTGNWKDKSVWSRDSEGMYYFLQRTFGFFGPGTVSPDATAATGIYDSSLTFLPLVAGADLNATNGVVVLPIASITSRVAKIEVIFADTDTSVLPSSIRHKTPLGTLIASPLSTVTFTTDLSTAAALTFSPIQRNTGNFNPEQVTSPTVFVWTGLIAANTSSVETEMSLPPGVNYRIRFAALKNFGRVGSDVGDRDWDIVLTDTFRLVY